MFGKRRIPEAKGVSVIGTGVWVQGPITSRGVLEIHGQIQGDIDHEGTLIIGSDAVCMGNIKATELVIAGEVHGNVHVRGSLRLAEGGRLLGDIACANLRVEMGSVLQRSEELH